MKPKHYFIAICLVLLSGCANNSLEVKAEPTQTPQPVQTTVQANTTAKQLSAVTLALETKTAPKPTPKPTAKPAEQPTATPEQQPKPSKGKMIAIDAGHQAKGNSEKEKIGPGAKTSKAKVASGTTGVFTKVPEYKLNLAVSQKLKQELENRGYSVYMVRETHDVNISNRERAENSANAGADILVRIHANGSEDRSVNGILTISPTKNNPYIPKLYKSSRFLSDCVVKEMITTTGAKNKGVWETDTMSGINWSTIPVTIVEMGFMSNEKEDKLMQQEEYQNKLVNGIANGIDLYYK